MDLTINGKDRQVSEEATVSDVLEDLEYDPDMVAVEVNETVVPGEAYEEQQLSDGDRMEIVTFVGGG